MRRVCLVILCGLCLLLPALASADAGNGGGSSPSSTAPNPQQITANYDTGYRALQAGDYKAAIRAFQKVLDADPNHAMAYTNMAYSYRRLGNYKKAIGLYNKALALHPDLAEAHEYLGAALAATGKIADAKRHLTILEKLNPELAEELRVEIAKHERRS